MANIAGMFAGLNEAIRGFGGTQGMPIPQDPRQRNALERVGVTNPMLQMFGQGLGALTGTDMRSREEQVAETVKGLDPQNPESLLKAAQAMEKYDPVQAAKLRGDAAKLIKEQKAAQAAAAQQEFTNRIVLEKLRQQGIEIKQGAGGALFTIDKNTNTVEQVSGAERKTETQTYIGEDGVTKLSRVIDSQTGETIAELGQVEAKPYEVKGDAENGFSVFLDGKLIRQYATAKEVQRANPEIEYILQKQDETGRVSSEFSRSQETLRKFENISPDEYQGGALGELKSSVYNLYGITDKSEQAKRDFIREKNTQIVESLPKGAASDRDIALFSAGFPPDNASYTEIRNYLEARTRVLAAAKDSGVAFATWVARGNSAWKWTLDKERYGAARSAYLSKDRSQMTPEQIEQDNKYFMDAFGHLPTQY